MRIGVAGLVGLVCCIPALASAAPDVELQQLKWFVHDSFGTLQDAQALVDEAMRAADLSYQGNQGSDVGIADVPCCSGFQAVSVALLTNPALEEISNEAEFDLLDQHCANNGNGACAFLVKVIDWCGTPSTSVIGCADTPICDTPPFNRLILAVSEEARLTGLLGETLAHERGHNACLDHVSDNLCQLMSASAGGGCIDASECSRIVDEAQTTSAQVCSCHSDGGAFEADGGVCTDVVTGICSGGVCGEVGSDASIEVLVAGGPEGLSTAAPDDALAISGLTGGWQVAGSFGQEMTGLAYAPERGTLYGLTAADALVTVDPQSGAILSTVANLPGGVRYNSLAFDPGPSPSAGDDRLLAMRTDDDCVNRDCFGPDPVCDDDLVSLDPDDGTVTPVVDICDAFCGGFQGLAYDTQNQRLIGSTFEATALFQIGETNTPSFPCQFPVAATDMVAPLIPSALDYHQDSHQLLLVGSPLPGPQLSYSVIDPDTFDVLIAHGTDGYTPGGLAAFTVPEPASAWWAACAGLALLARTRRIAGR